MTSKNAVAFAVLGVVIQGCASTGKSVLLSAGLGAVLGSSVGALAYPGRSGQDRSRNIIVGSVLGTLFGAGAGFVTHELVEKNKQEAYQKGKESSGSKQAEPARVTGQKPVLLPPKVESRFVDEAVRGNIFIPAHIEDQISEPARWSR